MKVIKLLVRFSFWSTVATAVVLGFLAAGELSGRINKLSAEVESLRRQVRSLEEHTILTPSRPVEDAAPRAVAPWDRVKSAAL